jgi:hypothetical protein
LPVRHGGVFCLLGTVVYFALFCLLFSSYVDILLDMFCRPTRDRIRHEVCCQSFSGSADILGIGVASNYLVLYGHYLEMYEH